MNINIYRKPHHLISTSNHNIPPLTQTRKSCNSFYFYIKPQRGRIPQQGTSGCNSFYFYIKPQHHQLSQIIHISCNSFYFYIKPQLIPIDNEEGTVVIHSISTSNHNLNDWVTPIIESCNSFYFYIKPQLSRDTTAYTRGCNSFYFYIKPQHYSNVCKWYRGCNSFYFYIKPQHRWLMR